MKIRRHVKTTLCPKYCASSVPVTETDILQLSLTIDEFIKQKTLDDRTQVTFLDIMELRSIN